MNGTTSQQIPAIFRTITLQQPGDHYGLQVLISTGTPWYLPLGNILPRRIEIKYKRFFLTFKSASRNSLAWKHDQQNTLEQLLLNVIFPITAKHGGYSVYLTTSQSIKDSWQEGSCCSQQQSCTGIWTQITNNVANAVIADGYDLFSATVHL